MPEASKDSKTYWIFFLISLAAFVLFLMFWSQWFWVILPFLLTSLVMAMNKL